MPPSGVRRSSRSRRAASASGRAYAPPSLRHHAASASKTRASARNAVVRGAPAGRCRPSASRCRIGSSRASGVVEEREPSSARADEREQEARGAARSLADELLPERLRLGSARHDDDPVAHGEARAEGREHLGVATFQAPKRVRVGGERGERFVVEAASPR